MPNFKAFHTLKHMRRILYIVLLWLWCLSLAQAQRADKWWAGISVEFAETKGLPGWAYGAEAGLAWKRLYAGAFVAQTTALLQGSENSVAYTVQVQYGGLGLAYHRPAIGVLEVVAGLRMGAGRALQRWSSATPPREPVKDALYLAIPFAGLELPLGASLSVGAFSSYRLFGGLDSIHNRRSHELWALANVLQVRYEWK